MELQLTFNDFLRLQGAQGASIEVIDGTAWVTEDGAAGDLFLEAGRSYRISGPGLVVVGADDVQCHARVVVREAGGPAPWRWLRALVASLARRREELETQRLLRELSDHALKDIGLSRDQL